MKDIDQCAVNSIYRSIIPRDMVIYGVSGINTAAHFLGF